MLRKGSVDHVKELIKAGQAAGSTRLFSVRHEFPAEWAKFQSRQPGENQRYELALRLRAEHYPFWTQGLAKSVTNVQILARSAKDTVPGSLEIADAPGKDDNAAKKDTLGKDAALGNLLVGKLKNIGLPSSPIGDLKLYFDDRAIADLWIALAWSA